MRVQQKLQEAGHGIDGPDVSIDSAAPPAVPKLQGAGQGIDGPDVSIAPAAPPGVQKLQARAMRIISQMREILRTISELGVEVKAADGLVDSRTRLHGRTVYLCWKFGEERVTHFHDLDKGFAGRRPIPDDGDFIGDLLH